MGEHLTLANYADVARDEYFHVIFARTFGMAVLVTLICIAIGVPEAYVLSRLSERWRAVSIVIVLGPMLISVVVRTLGWAVLLGNEGVINKLLLATGLVAEPVQADVHLHRRRRSRWCTCWCRSWCWRCGPRCKSSTPPPSRPRSRSAPGCPTVLRRIVFPQVIPGVLSGGLIVFSLAASAFATPAIIGGRRLKVVPDHDLRRIPGQPELAAGRGARRDAAGHRAGRLAGHEPLHRAPLQAGVPVKRTPLPLLVFHWLFGAFMLAPLVMVALVSFTDKGYIALPFDGASWRWYRAILDNRDFVDAFWRSLALATVSRHARHAARDSRGHGHRVEPLRRAARRCWACCCRR